MAQIESPDIEIEKIKIEHEKIRLEQARLHLEEERFRYENRYRRLTIISIFIPLATIAITVIFGIVSQNKQAEIDFNLRVADTVMNSKSPDEAKSKLRAIQSLLPNQIPDNFSSELINFDPTAYSGEPSYDNKMNFLNLMANGGATKGELLDMYNKLFPGSLIINAIEK